MTMFQHYSPGFRLLDADEFALLRHDEKSLLTYLISLKHSIEAWEKELTNGRSEPRVVGAKIFSSNDHEGSFPQNILR